MPQFQLGKSKVDLNDSTFVAEGGEGAVHIIGNLAIKVCKQPPPVEKLKELAKLRHDNIIAPKKLLRDIKGEIVGYSMDAVEGKPLASIITKSYRVREGLSPDKMIKLVEQVSEGLKYVHSKDMLQVDGNELNYMVTSDHKKLYFIDVASFQTPSFPANAIMASIRDWTVTQGNSGWEWSTDSDWWSYAIISWQMFTGIHPFKARHPGISGKDFFVEQMKNKRSVLSSKVVIPKGAVFWPFENVIPGGKDGAYMQWYRALFVEGKRGKPPETFQATITVQPQVSTISDGDSFTFTLIGDHSPSEYSFDSEEVLECMEIDGRLYVRRRNDICEVQIVELKNQAPKHVFNPVAQIMPNATTCFEGAAFQNMMGSIVASVFPSKGMHRQVRIKELAGHVITAAKHERGVLIVIALCRATGRTNRFIFRFKLPEYSTYDCRLDEDILPSDANMTVTEKGVCICIPEDGVVELFSAKLGSNSVKRILDQAITSDMKLFSRKENAYIQRGGKEYRFAMKEQS